MTHRFAHRMDSLPPYLFAQLEQKIQEKRDAGEDVISLGIGDPDIPTPEPIIESLCSAAGKPDTHQYPSNLGRPKFREAIADFYDWRFGVDLDPATQVMPVLGGKEAIFHISFVTLDPGDVALITDPGYPVYTSGPLLAGATPHPMPLTPGNDYLPDLDAVPSDVLAQARLLFLNYPNNPTGAVIPDGSDFFERVVAFARKHDLIVVHDNAYSEISFDGYRAPSFLETPGAADVGIEMFSLSKAWNMTGWRVGACVGNEEIVRAFWTYKTNVDSGMFEAVQMAAVTALTESRSFPDEMSKIYQRRRDLVVDTLQGLGIDVVAPKGTIYVWVPVPKGQTSAEFCELVLEQTGVVISPGASYGDSGEGFIRISLSTPDERLREAIKRMESRLRVPVG